ncbi:MAG: type II secretion system protein GspD [Sedimentisphaerales bacterium]|nr:type II secretion system protein GspD [Sedimentisphaerales bacterium]
MNCILGGFRAVSIALVFCLGLSVCLWGQEATLGQGESQEAGSSVNNTAERITASIYYPDVEPRQLFQMLSETFRVQFEGVDTVTGPLSLISSEQEMVDVEGMLDLLDAVLSEQNRITVREGQIIRIVPVEDVERSWIMLEHADPQGVYQFLRDLYITGREEGQPRMRVIRLHPDLPRIFLVGPRDLVAEIEELVRTELDIAPGRPGAAAASSTDMQVRYLPLDYIDASEFRRILENDQIIAGAFSSAVAPNNTLIVSAADAAVFVRVDEMKSAFDVDRMEIRYYPLSNALADEVATLLTSIYPAETEVLPEEISQARRRALASAGMSSLATVDATEFDPALAQELRAARAGAIDPRVQQLLSGSITIVSAGELTIIPDPSRNGLLIRTFSRNFPKILELIQQLDRPQPQVMIDVFITEVTLDDSLELGVDFSYTGRMEDNRRTYTVGQDLGTALDTLGLSYQLVSDNINGYIRALQETGQLDVITRPQIVTKDNVQAVVEFGRRVPFLTTTTVSTEGAINSTVTYQDVVTRLDVTPHIHPDGYVSLSIHQTIDDVSTETFQISEDFNPQVIIKRQAITQVRVKDGQTVCLGGFISDSITEDENRVPILSDIPLLGLLFTYTERQHTQTEMIIFITPHILETPTELLRMTNSQRELVESQITDDRRREVLEIQETLVYPRYADPIIPTDAE